jgi:hypothetical protein
MGKLKLNKRFECPKIKELGRDDYLVTEVYCLRNCISYNPVHRRCDRTDRASNFKKQRDTKEMKR